jgi:CD109 antigen
VPEGIPRFITNSTIIVKNSNTTAAATELTCSLPPSAVNDTIKVSASVAGDILGSSLNNLEKLIQMPYGCGEQNMLNFVPNIVILRYLEASNKLTEAIKLKIVRYTELGYQRELEYRRSDGSFSAFGNSDAFGSSWLTGFVLKSFYLAKPYITIDMAMFNSSLTFLISKQNLDGSFREDGRVIHSDMQGGSSSGIPLTAYISIVLTECLSEFPQYQTQRDKALNYLIAHYNASDVYALGILSYALSLANNPSYPVVFTKFYMFAIENEFELHWEKIKEVNPNQYYYQPSSLDVEISSYALLALYNKDISKSLKIIRWIVKQQNSIGGFKSTQDTVVALEALAKFAAQFTLSISNLILTVMPNAGISFTASVNSANALVLQSFDLLPSVRKLSVLTSVSGTGLAIVSLSCNYYEVIENLNPRFRIEHRFEDPCLGYLKSSICLSHIPSAGSNVSNMVLVTVKLPSGFIYEERKILNSVISVSFSRFRWFIF